METVAHLLLPSVTFPMSSPLKTNWDCWWAGSSLTRNSLASWAFPLSAISTKFLVSPGSNTSRFYKTKAKLDFLYPPWWFMKIILFRKNNHKKFFLLLHWFPVIQATVLDPFPELHFIQKFVKSKHIQCLLCSCSVHYGQRMKFVPSMPIICN